MEPEDGETAFNMRAAPRAVTPPGAAPCGVHCSIPRLWCATGGDEWWFSDASGAGSVRVQKWLDVRSPDWEFRAAYLGPEPCAAVYAPAAVLTQ